MNLLDFQQRLDLYGADFAAWPEDQRLQGEKLVATSSAAMISFQQALEIEIFLKDSPDIPSITEGLEGRILHQARQQGLSAAPEQGNSIWSLLAGVLERSWEHFSYGLRPAYACCAMVFFAAYMGYGFGVEKSGMEVTEAVQLASLTEEEAIFIGLDDPLFNWFLWGQDASLAMLEADL